MRRLLPLALLCLIPLGAGPPPPKPAPAPLALTDDERSMLLGFHGRAQAIQLRAEHELAKLGGEQTTYLGRVAARLGIPADRLLVDYAISLETGRVERKGASR
jgi:hypothetical protein